MSPQKLDMLDSCNWQHMPPLVKLRVKVKVSKSKGKPSKVHAMTVCLKPVRTICV